MTHLTLRTVASRRSITPAGVTGLTLPAFVLLCLAGASVLYAQEDKLPKGETILDKYVEATGGKAAYEKLNNRVAKATVEILGTGIKFSVTIHLAKPNLSYTLIESEAFGKKEKGTDGEVVWEKSVMTGPVIKEGDERAVVLRAAVFNGTVHWRKLFKKIECVGVETIEDKPCYKVVLTPNEGPSETRYYDKKTNLIVKTEMSLKLPVGVIPLESYPSDYRKVDGILLQHRIRQVVAGMQELLTVVESIEHNVEMPKDRFKLPEDVRALVDKQKSKESAAVDTQTDKVKAGDRRNVVITVVYDNNPGLEGLTTDWGFGCLIQGTQKTILFDTGGNGRILLENMGRLNLDPNEIDVVVLSHIHGDHTGGLASVARDRKDLPVYIPVGFPSAFKDHVRSLKARPIEAATSEVICRGVRTTGTLGKGAIEEQGLCVKTRRGWVLITGCAHPGVERMAAQAKEITGGPICLVMGGFHLLRRSPSQINAVIDRFKELGIQRVAPVHCTGEPARNLFKQRFGEGCNLGGVGTVFEFDQPD